jgi:hypothetical protein
MSYAFIAPYSNATPVQDRDAARPGIATGTLVLTKTGERAVESLRPGDKIITRSRGFTALRWVGITTNKGPAPIHISAGALGDHQAITVSASTRFLIRGAVPLALFGSSEVVVQAADLVNNRSIYRLDAPRTLLVHLMFDSPEIIRAAGMEVETLNPIDHPLQELEASSTHLRLVAKNDTPVHYVSDLTASMARAKALLVANGR